MLTEKGKVHVKRYIAQQVPSIAKSICFGIGEAAESTNDERLAFEIGRAEILLVTPNFTTDEVIYKAQVPSNFAGIITEVGLYSLATDTRAGGFGARIISTFDQNRETWDNTPNFTTANTRLGGSSLNHQPAAGSTNTNTLQEAYMDLSGYSGADKFVLAYNASNTNVSNIMVDFMTDSTNYYTVTFTGSSSGYNVVETTKSAATATGSPSWSDINQLRVTTTAKSGGSTVVDLDGLRIDDADGSNPDYVLVARKVLDTHFVKRDGIQEEIEFRIGMSV